MRTRSLPMPCSLYSCGALARFSLVAGWWAQTYVDDAESLVDRGLGVEGEAGVDLGRDLAGNNVEDLLAELDEEVVEGGVNLVLNVVAVLLAPGDGSINELLVLGLLGGRENQRGVGGGILGLVLVDGGKVTRVADDGLGAWSAAGEERGGGVVGLLTVPEAFN
jgi:hypothetical protein